MHAEKRGPGRFASPPVPPVPPILLLLEELLVEEEDEQVDVDFGFVEHLHDGYALVLQLQQVLQEGWTSPRGGGKRGRGRLPHSTTAPFLGQDPPLSPQLPTW